MANSADPDQLASSEQLIWIYTVCKGRVFPGLAGQGLLYVFMNTENISKYLELCCQHSKAHLRSLLIQILQTAVFSYFSIQYAMFTVCHVHPTSLQNLS